MKKWLTSLLVASLLVSAAPTMAGADGVHGPDIHYAGPIDHSLNLPNGTTVHPAGYPLEKRNQGQYKGLEVYLRTKGVEVPPAQQPNDSPFATADIISNNAQVLSQEVLMLPTGRVHFGILKRRVPTDPAVRYEYWMVVQSLDTQQTNMLWNYSLIGVSYNKHLPNAKTVMLELLKYWQLSGSNLK